MNEARTRIARRVKQLNLPQEPLLKTAGEILAPALGAFVQWVLGQALAEGVSRLYFLARDGWFPYQMGRCLCQAWGLPLDCRYLYGSRYAWRLPLYHLDHAGAVRQLCGKLKYAHPENVLRQGGLSTQEREALLAELGLEKTVPAKELAGKLLSSSTFTACLDRHSRQAFPALGGYLDQEGLLEPVSWAVVDSGWMGSTQETLAEVLRCLGWKGTVRGYYAGLYRKPLAGEWNCFFFRPGKDWKMQRGMEPSFFEGVFAAPQGMTLGYDEIHGEFIPVFGSAPVTAGISEAMGNVFRSYGELLAGEGVPADLFSRGKEEGLEAWKGLWQVMTRPTWEQAAALGQMAFSHSPWDRETFPLAEPLTEEELKRNHLPARLVFGMPEKSSAWLPGSAALYGENPRKHFRGFDRVRWARTVAHVARSWLRPG